MAPVEERLTDPLNDKFNEEEECVDWGSDAEDEVAFDAEKGTSSAGNGGDDDEKDGSMCVAICTLCAAVPALVGSWCWPILVGAIFAVAAGNVNGGLVDFFHGVQVAIMLTLMTNIVQFAYWNVQKKRKGKGHWHMYQPVYLLVLSTFLVCTQPVCMLVIGSWKCDGNFSNDQLADGITQGADGYYNGDSKVAWGFNRFGSLLAAENDKTGITDSSIVAYSTNTAYPDGCSTSMKNFFFEGANTNALVPDTTVGWMIQIFCTYLGFLLMFVGVCQATMLHKKIAKKWADIRKAAN